MIQSQYDLNHIEEFRECETQVVMGFDEETKQRVVCIVIHKGNRVFKLPLNARQALDLGTLLMTGGNALANFNPDAA